MLYTKDGGHEKPLLDVQESIFPYRATPNTMTMELPSNRRPNPSFPVSYPHTLLLCVKTTIYRRNVCMCVLFYRRHEIDECIMWNE